MNKKIYIRKFVYALLGALIGVPVGFILSIGSCMVSCFKEGLDAEGIELSTSLIIGATVCGIIGFIVGIRTDKEDKEWDEYNAEEEHQEELKRALNEWDDELCRNLYTIQYEVEDKNYKYPPIPKTNIYSNIWSLLDKADDEQSERYTDLFNKRINQQAGAFRKIIENAFTTQTGSRHLRRAYNSITHLYYIHCSHKNEKEFGVGAAKDALGDFYRYVSDVSDCDGSTYYLKIKNHGNCILPLKDDKEYPINKENVDKAILEIDRKIKILENMEALKLSQFYATIARNLTTDFVSESCKAMWFFAIQKPFDVDKFEHARAIFNKFTMWNSEDDDYIYSVPVESVLAGIYAKNNIGGKDAVKQEEKYIFEWLNYAIRCQYYENCFNLASGLAWLELFEYEKKVLLSLVYAQVQLTPELQERLEFLNKGISQNIKVYNLDKSSIFMFDSSSLEWNNNDFDVFFRNAEMKKISLNYSLTISKWTKTLPLASGQKVSQSEIYSEFMSMIQDFDGEVSCRKVNARAVNLENLEYEDAIEFHFNSKRNACISVLFSCEKYGRNLNLTILTLFTPDLRFDNNTLKHYALAIKENIYMESFRESILQSLDNVLKENKPIYDEEDNNCKKAFE